MHLNTVPQNKRQHDHMIPLSKVHLSEMEIKNLTHVLETGHWQGDGEFTKLCEKAIEEQTGASRVLLTTSGTHALELAALLLDLQAGDEVIMPSFTFSSTANAVLLRGATPVFVDIDAKTLNLDPEAVTYAVSSKTKVIVPVHYGGVNCNMQALQAIADNSKIEILEDAAHCFLASHKGRPLGTTGSLAIFSFHQTKNIACGEGGALLINDPKFVERAEIIREKGTNRKSFLRGEVDKYSWRDIGSSYVPSDLLAALLWAQIQSAENQTHSRLLLFDRYYEAFEDLEKRGLVRRPCIPLESRHNAHIFFLILENSSDRESLIRFMRERRVVLASHFVPLHSAPMGLRFGRTVGSMKETDSIASSIVRLPLYAGLSGQDQDYVIECLYEFFNQSGFKPVR